MPIPLNPGYVRFDGTKFVTDISVVIVGPPGPQGPPGIQGAIGPQGPSGSGGVSTGNYNYVAGVSLYDFVYMVSSDIIGRAYGDTSGGIPQHSPTIGVITGISIGMGITVQYEGEVPGFSGLTQGATYYLSPTSPGGYTLSAPTTGQVLQKVGFAKDATHLVLMIDRDIVVL